MAEQATGYPSPSEQTPPGQRTVLVVDLDGDPLAPPRTLEEILLRRGTWEDDDRQDQGHRHPVVAASGATGPLRTELISLLAR